MKLQFFSWRKRFVYKLKMKSPNQPNWQNGFLAKNAIKIFLLNEHIQSKLTNKYCKTGVCKRVHSWKVDLSRPQIYIRGYSRSLFCVTIACNHLPFFKIFSSFVYFCTNFQIYFINISLPFFWKIPPMPLLYRPCISVIEIQENKDIYICLFQLHYLHKTNVTKTYTI